MKKFVKNIISYLIIFSLILSNVQPIIIYAAEYREEVKVKVSNSPKINILLTQNETSFDLMEFEPDLRASLEAKGLDTSNITFQAMEQTTDATDAEDVDFAKAVNSWISVGAPVWSANGNLIYCNIVEGNPNPTTGTATANRISDKTKNWVDMNTTRTADWGSALISPYNFDTEEIHASFIVEKNGNLNNGFCFMVTQNDDKDKTLNGYFFNVVSHAYYATTNDKDAPISSGSGVYTLTLWRFDNYDMDSSWSTGAGSVVRCTPSWGSVGQSYTDGTETVKKLATWSYARQPNTYATYTVDAKDGQITIKMDGNIVANVFDDTYLTGTYGFWGHNCERQASMRINNLNAETTKTIKKTYSELLNAPTWDDDAMHIIVNVDESNDTSLNTPENIAKTLADKISFIQWGSNANEAGIKNFIKSNDNNGLFLSPNTYENDINDTADYIIRLIQQEYDSDYIVLGREATITVIPSNLKDGATSSLYPNGRWLTRHDHTYFENDLGQSTQVGMYTPDLTCDFDKPGKYEMYFDDELVKTVYVHRAPVADFAIKINGSSLELTNKSFDLDKNTDMGYGKGIASETWYYKDATAATWTKGKLSEFDNTKVRMIKLEVEDYQGEKASTIKYVGKGDPVASFNLSAYTFSKYAKLQVNDTSYDPQGYDITGWTWKLRKENLEAGTSSVKEPNFDFRTLGTGKYTLTLSITNSKGVTSGEYARTFNVIDDTDPATVVITPTSCENTQTQDILLEFSDADSGFNKWRYVFTKSQTPPTEGWSEYKTTDTDTLTINKDGNWYLHLEAYDIEGNLMKRTVGTYKIRHYYTNTYKHVLFGFNNREGNYSNSQGYLLNTLQENVIWGEQIIPNERKTITIPNGCYAVQKYGTADIEEVYTEYNSNIPVTQDSKGLSFQMDYYPTEYTITYDLAGGKLKGSIPATYTVFYGVTYAEAERVGYTFQGWYDQNGNKVTGVNEGKNATFASVEEIYQELATRQTGNIEITARWEINELPLETTADNTANDNQGAVELDWSNYDEEKAVYKTYRHDERQGENEYSQMTYITQPVAEKTIIDNEGKDVKAPTKPIIELTAKNVYSYSSIDRGSTYKYYVESYDPADTDNRVQISNISEVTVESGFKEYRYLFDDDENTVLTATSGKSTTEESIRFTRELKYLHIAGVDKAGNVSETATVEIQQYQDYVINYYLQNLDGQTYTLDKTVRENAFIGTAIISEMDEHEGFKTPEIQNAEVDVDVVEINYYYERNKYTIGLEKVEGVNSISGDGTYYYGEEVTIDAEVDDRYQWINWTGSETTDEKTHTIIVPSTNLLYTANALLKTRIEVKYLDKYTREKLAESKEYKGLYGDPYNIREDKQQFEGYTLIEEPTKTGIMMQAEKELIFYYAKNTQITAKYIEQDSGIELAQTIVKTGYEGLGYATEEKEIEGYTLVEKVGQPRGTMPREASEIIYYYLKDTSVTVKYIDKNTNEELLEEVVYEGLYGNDFDIRGDKQQIEGYTLIEEPVKQGTMEKAPITLTYYYAKDTQVTVKYLEQDNEEELVTTIIIPGYEALPYETEEKAIPGYTLVETTGEPAGEMPRENSIVTYYYLKDTSVTVKYIDKNTGDKLAETIIYEGLYGDAYDVREDKQEIAEFTLIEEPEYKTGTMEKEPMELVYYYAKTTEVTVKYLEQDTLDELEDTIILEGYEALSYETEEKEIEGYTLVETTGELVGEMPREASEVVYYYLKDTSVTVKYIDKNTNEELLSQVIYEGLYGDSYDVRGDKQEIEGYTLLEEPEYETGSMEKEPIELVYYYAKDTQVTVKYIEKDNGRELEETIIIPGYETKEYTTEEKGIEGYTLVETIGEPAGEMPREASEVVYYYLKDTRVTVKYVDKNTEEELLPRVIHEGLYGDSYDITADKQEIPGFTLIEEAKATGTMEKEPITLTYYYAKDTKVTVRYLEKDSGEELAEEIILEGYESKKYRTEEKKVEGYTLVSVAGRIEGNMPRKESTVVYYYLKNTTLEVDYVDKNTGEKIVPSTVYQGLYGDRYNVVKDEKAIPGYTLIESPVKIGTMEKEAKTLTYYYAKNSRVIVRYIEENTGQRLSEETLEGYEGRDYRTREKIFTGYSLVETKGKEEGKMTRDVSYVTYYYLKNTELKINYIDKNTKEKIAETVVHKGLMGDSYNLEKDRKIISGYTLLEEPEKTGIMNQESKEVTYYYAKNTEMIIRYIEENTGKDLELMKIVNGYEGKEYSETAMEIEGYTLVTTPKTVEGTLNRNVKEIDFYYLKKATIKVEYKNKKTEEDVAEAVTYDVVYGAKYDISKDKKEIRGYKLVEEPKATGRIEEEEIILTYYYEENKEIKIQFIDRNTGEILVATGFENKKEETKEEIIEQTKEQVEKENLPIEKEEQIKTEEKAPTTIEGTTRVEENTEEVIIKTETKEENNTEEKVENTKLESKVEKTEKIKEQIEKATNKEMITVRRIRFIGIIAAILLLRITII